MIHKQIFLDSEAFIDKSQKKIRSSNANSILKVQILKSTFKDCLNNLIKFQNNQVSVVRIQDNEEKFLIHHK